MIDFAELKRRYDLGVAVERLIKDDMLGASEVHVFIPVDVEGHPVTYEVKVVRA